MGGWMGGEMDGRMDGETDGWKEGWKDGWMRAAPMGGALGQHLREGNSLKVAFVLTTSSYHLRKVNQAKDMQVLQDRVIAENPHVCLWQQESLPAAAAESRFHRALQRHRSPPGPPPHSKFGRMEPRR